MNATATKKLEGEPSDFVFAGRRRGSKGGLIDYIYLMNKDGSLGRAMGFKATRSRRVMGGVYTGARFSETQAFGIDLAKWTSKRIEDAALIIEWEAKESEAETQVKLQKLEADAKQVGHLDMEMLNLRRLWSAMRKRGDYEGAEALELAVMRSLRKGVKE